MSATQAACDRSPWRAEHRRLIGFLDEVGATDHVVTVVHSPQPIEATSEDELSVKLDLVIGPDLPWEALTFAHGDEPMRWMAYALPVSSRWRRSGDPGVVLYLSLHMSLVAWWLCTAWRVRQLAETGLALADAEMAIPAAACVRALMETAASLWVDGHNVADAWSDLKTAGPFHRDPEWPAKFETIRSMLVEATVGSRFDSRVPRLQEAWGVVTRTNVLSHLDKLAKAHPGRLQEDYQWLCNAVHPSLGNMLAFAEPWFERPGFTIKHFAARPVGKAPGHPIPDDPQYIEQQFLVQKATARAAEVATEVLRHTMDATLSLLDDVALTTGAPPASRDPYWRQLSLPARNDACPCRSGRKAKLCSHSWGTAGPLVPS